MSKQTDTSLFIHSSMPRLYQSLLAGVASYQELGKRVLREIKAAHAFRKVEQVKELAGILINIPIKEYRLIAQYYLIWCGCRSSDFKVKELERIIDQSQTYKSTALASRAAFGGFQGQTEQALYFYSEALKTARNVTDYVGATLGIAMIKGIEGFHESALKDIESVIPFAHHAETSLYFNLYNSYATELGAVGLRSEARNISRMVLASPFAPAYPEWQETGRENGLVGRESPRSYVSLETDRIEQHALPVAVETPNPAKVLSFPKLKEVPPPEKPEKVTPLELSEMTMNEKQELLYAALRSGAIHEGEYNKLIVMFGLLDAGPAAAFIDLEDETTLDDLMVVWAYQIDPEQLTGVLSALRDCKDDQRRNNLLDRMIRKTFQCGMESKLTEEEWRLKFERKLPIK